MAGAVDRFGQAIELRTKAADFQRIGYHPPDRQLQDLAQVGFPTAHVGLRAGHGDSLAVDGQCQNGVALGKGIGHQRGDARNVDFQWVDAHIGLAGLLRQPLGQAFEVQRLTAVQGVGQALAGEQFQGVQVMVGCVAACA